MWAIEKLHNARIETILLLMESIEKEDEQVARKVRMSGWNAPAVLADRIDSYIKSIGGTYAGLYENAIAEYLDREIKALGKMKRACSYCRKEMDAQDSPLETEPDGTERCSHGMCVKCKAGIEEFGHDEWIDML